jgi:hypothetical protein
MTRRPWEDGSPYYLRNMSSVGERTIGDIAVELEKCKTVVLKALEELDLARGGVPWMMHGGYRAKAEVMGHVAKAETMLRELVEGKP